MNESELRDSISQYNEQLGQVKKALSSSSDSREQESLRSLQSDLEQLLALTQESLQAITSEPTTSSATVKDGSIDDEYALFMSEMAKSGAYDKKESKEETSQNSASDSDLEDELSSLPGTKCGVYHTHKWGGQPTLHNAMVAAVESHGDGSQLSDLQVRVLFTHPTHAEMLPCPFFLDGECKFNDEQCRYSHGELVPFSKLQEAIEPNFDNLKPGSHVLVKLKPPDGEDISLTKKSSEKYHLWHRGVVKSTHEESKTCQVRLEQGSHAGEKRKSNEEIKVAFEELFPLNDDNILSSDSDDSLSDTEYPEVKQTQSKTLSGEKLIVEKSLQYNGPAMGEWERHTRGIGSKLMFAMGYVAGTGLGASADGRLEPVPARVLPVGKSLDHCMRITENNAEKDPLKVEQKLKRLQKKEEERNKRAYEREQERERRNVFNFLNKTLGNKPKEVPASTHTETRNTIKQTSNKDLNIEQFKITEEVKRVEKDVVKLKNSLYRHAQGSNIHKNMSGQLAEKMQELDALKKREKDIVREQSSRKDKQKLTMF